MSRDFSSFGLLKISGPDASKFLQGQLTCDVTKINPNNWQLAAHCNPQGRIISLFHLIRIEDAFYLFMQKEMLAPTMAVFKKYAVFYKAQMEVVTEPLEQTQACYNDIIKNNLPILYVNTSGKFLPHELNLQHSAALDFDKGCYTGQEIIARMHYKAKLKSQLYHYQLLSSCHLAPGTEIYIAPDRVCGTVVNYWQDAKKEFALVIMNDSERDAAHYQLKDGLKLNLQLTTSSSDQ